MHASLVEAAGALLHGCGSATGRWEKAFECGKSCEVIFACTGSADVGTFTPRGCASTRTALGSAGDRLCERHENGQDAEYLRCAACALGDEGGGGDGAKQEADAGTSALERSGTTSFVPGLAADGPRDLFLQGAHKAHKETRHDEGGDAGYRTPTRKKKAPPHR
mmetsp:Transcript_101766/g.311209  ORF Transcript_101766/g.311209 Transcript_101766/m.311209 type:complete len:164 (-) Transcript_101766:263-754(-)